MSGESYDDFIARHLFQPLGMSESGALDDGRAVPNLAVGYDPGFGPTRVQPAAEVSRSWLQGSGSLYASTRDLLRWLEAVRDDRITDVDALPYPYGWGRRTRFDQPVLEQTGRVPIGYASYMAWYQRDDLMIVLLSNIRSEVVQQMGEGLAAIALGRPYETPRMRPGSGDPPPNDSTAFAAYPGRYEIAHGFVLTVRAVPRGILIAGPDGALLPADFQQDDRFFFRPLYVPVAFQRDAQGRIRSLDWAGQFQARRLDGNPGAGPGP